uniref:Ig-like domain-containing protein n=1 Tax=Fundulus heteroclitus TaxID=8078 RepID=A0A3Q2P8N5_FUNHE
MSDLLFLLCVIQMLWSAVAAIQVDIPKKEYEFIRGDNITLPCTFKTTLSNPPIVIISWSATGPDTPADEVSICMSVFQFNELGYLSNTYEGRVSVDVNVASGKADLKLSSITMAENKEFECHVQIPGDDEGQPADTAHLTVLGPPSPPICRTQGKAEYGQNISLTCNSMEGFPPPSYRWESWDMNGTSRVQDPSTADKGGILSLFNISKETSGYYTCTSSNKIRSASCNITVTVLPPSMNIGSTAGIIAGVVIGLIILVIAIFCCCRRKNKKGNEERVSMNGYYDAAKEPLGNGDGHLDVDLEKSRVSKPADRRDDRSDYDDRRSDYDDRRSDYNDRRSDYNDRRSDYDDRRSDYDDRRSDYDDRRSKHSDRHERYDDDRRFEDERRYNDRRDPRYDDDRYNDRDKP